MATQMQSHHARTGEHDAHLGASGPALIGAVAFILVLVVWPLPTLAIAMLVAAALMLASIYADARGPRHVHRHAHTRSFARHMPSISGAAIVLTIAASFLWPEVMVVVGVGAAVMACTAWIVYERVTRDVGASRAARR